MADRWSYAVGEERRGPEALDEVAAAKKQAVAA